jgi:hypothetical protein
MKKKKTHPLPLSSIQFSVGPQSVILVSLSGISCQAFFIHRSGRGSCVYFAEWVPCWKHASSLVVITTSNMPPSIWRFSRNKGLTSVLAAACLATAILDIVMAGRTIHNKIAGLTSRTCTAEVIAVFAVGAGGMSTFSVHV